MEILCLVDQSLRWNGWKKIFLDSMGTLAVLDKNIATEARDCKRFTMVWFGLFVTEDWLTYAEIAGSLIRYIQINSLAQAKCTIREHLMVDDAIDFIVWLLVWFGLVDDLISFDFIRVVRVLLYVWIFIWTLYKVRKLPMIVSLLNFKIP